ncbi:MAG: helix-turn-helix transcriptional regulator [Bacteroidota bacterium]
MKERLIQVLDLEQLTPSKFADIIGVQRSSVSHVISGRNNPSFDFLQKTLRAFPGLNAEWLILGEGSMYEQMGRTTSGNLFEAPVEKDQSLFEENIPAGDTESGFSDDSQELEQVENGSPDDVKASTNQDVKDDVSPQIPGKEGKVLQVMIFYDDNTFRTYNPAE